LSNVSDAASTDNVSDAASTDNVSDAASTDNVSASTDNQNTRFMPDTLFFKNRAVYEIMWKNMVSQTGRHS
jgi:hypothetical protein